ncbi:MAG: hypothetical protein ACRDRA_11275 [Pseudonocardiaceae bacterium]
MSYGADSHLPSGPIELTCNEIARLLNRLITDPHAARCHPDLEPHRRLCVVTGAGHRPDSGRSPAGSAYLTTIGELPRTLILGSKLRA